MSSKRITLLNEKTKAVFSGQEDEYGHVISWGLDMSDVVKLVPLTVPEICQGNRQIKHKDSGIYAEYYVKSSSREAKLKVDHFGIQTLDWTPLVYKLGLTNSNMEIETTEESFNKEFWPLPRKGDSGLRGGVFIEDANREVLYFEDTVLVKKVKIEKIMTYYYYKSGNDLRVFNVKLEPTDDPWVVGKTYKSTCGHAFTLDRKETTLFFKDRAGYLHKTDLCGIRNARYAPLHILPEEYIGLEVPGWGKRDGKLVKLLGVVGDFQVKYTDGQITAVCDATGISKLKTLNGVRVEDLRMSKIAVTDDDRQLFYSNGMWHGVHHVA